LAALSVAIFRLLKVSTPERSNAVKLDKYDRLDFEGKTSGNAEVGLGRGCGRWKRGDAFP
jgi:hypothetical protein